MAQKINNFVKTEVVLWGLKMLAPLLLVIVIERMMGPGSSAKASQLFPYLLIVNIALGMASFLNLTSAMKSSSEKPS